MARQVLALNNFPNLLEIQHHEDPSQPAAHHLDRHRVAAHPETSSQPCPQHSDLLVKVRLRLEDRRQRGPRPSLEPIPRLAAHAPDLVRRATPLPLFDVPAVEPVMPDRRAVVAGLPDLNHPTARSRAWSHSPPPQEGTAQFTHRLDQTDRRGRTSPRRWRREVARPTGGSAALRSTR